MVLAQAPPAEDESDAPMQEVVVTGSRIIESPVEATSRVTTVTRADIDRAGADSIGKILQTLPANTGSPKNTNVNNGGDGSTRIDLRGLGDCRTVVLLNGRRLPNAGSGGDCSPDLNMVPLSLIDRVEVLASGASAVYGADAIGGVVNILTRSSLDGVEGGASYVLAEKGDGDTVNAWFMAGQELSFGNVAVGFDYTDQRAVLGGAREYSSQTEFLTADLAGYIPSGSGTIPQGRFFVPAGNLLGLPQPPPMGTYTLREGASGDAAADYRLFNPGFDAYNFAPDNYLQTPSRRSGFWLQGEYEAPRNVKLGLEFLTHHRESDQLLAAAPYTTQSLGGAPILANGMQGIPASNYYNPFGVDVPLVSRRFVESGGRSFSQEFDALRIALTATGPLGASWEWSSALSWFENETLTESGGALRNDRLQRALGPSGPDGSGRIVCGQRNPATGTVPDAAIIPDCVPLDLFGGVGTITQEMLDYVAQPLIDLGQNRQTLFTADARGQLGALPDGPVRWAVGFEFRDDRTELVIDPAKLDGTAGSGGEFNVPDGGSFRAREAFVETLLPLLRARPAADDLTLTASGRYSDFSSFGDRTTWQGGLRWAPVRGLGLRASYGKVFRAPPNGDLFWVPIEQFDPFVLDPCGDSPTAAQRVNCAANGVPGGEYVQDSEILFAQGGNPDLKPERGDSLTYGFEWRPGFAGNLVLAVDRWRVDLDDRIGELGIETVLNGCADTGAASVCNAIARNPDGSIRRVDLRRRNLASALAEGVDATIEWRLQTDRDEWDLKLLGTYTDTYDITTFAGATARSFAGQYSPELIASYPRVRSQASVQWSRGPWVASWAGQYISGMTECGEAFVPGTYVGCLEADSVLFHDLQFGWSRDEGPRITFSAMNVTDEDPPRLNFEGGFGTDPATYRLLGRSYMVRIAATFE